MWHEMAKCNHCNKIVCEYQFSSSFFKPVCPECGGKNDFSKVTAKVEFNRKWYKPWTWLDIVWVEKE